MSWKGLVLIMPWLCAAAQARVEAPIPKPVEGRENRTNSFMVQLKDGESAEAATENLENHGAAVVRQMELGNVTVLVVEAGDHKKEKVCQLSLSLSLPQTPPYAITSQCKYSYILRHLNIFQ